MFFKSFENIFFMILITLLLINLFNKEGYKDCKGLLYNKNLEEIKKNKHEVLLGYNSNDYIYPSKDAFILNVGKKKVFKIRIK